MGRTRRDHPRRGWKPRKDPNNRAKKTKIHKDKKHEYDRKDRSWQEETNT